jgi:hypothetical protein
MESITGRDFQARGNEAGKRRQLLPRVNKEVFFDLNELAQTGFGKKFRKSSLINGGINK